MNRIAAAAVILALASPALAAPKPDPALHAQAVDRPEGLFWEHQGNAAVRLGEWKLVRLHGKPWELYDLSSDRTELNDLAKKQAGEVEELKKLYQAWADRSGVLPWPVKKNKKR